MLWGMLEPLKQDVTFSLRVLRRQKTASAVAALCLALGIGGTATMFSVGNTLLLRPLPYPAGSRLFTIRTEHKGASGWGVASYPDFVDWRARQRAFSDIAAVGAWNFVLTDVDAQRVAGAVSSPNLFRVLGVTPEAGRLFREDEGRMAPANVALVSHGLAEREFGGASAVLNHTIHIGGEPYTVVGIIPESGRYPWTAELWTPYEPSEQRANRGIRNAVVLGAIRDGTTRSVAQRDMASIASELAREYPATNATVTTNVLPLRDAAVSGAMRGLVALSAATLLVLLVACANVAGLQLARATQRDREIAIRAAVGAGRRRILRQLLTENVMLALVGGILGIAIVTQAAGVVARALEATGPAWLTYDVDMRALAFVVAISACCGIFVGLVPALKLSAQHPADVLRAGRGQIGGSQQRAQRALVVAEIALSIVLLTGASLVFQSIVKVMGVRPGFNASGLLTFRLSLQTPRYDIPANRGGVIARMTGGIARLPGVKAAAATSMLPIADCCTHFRVIIEGRPQPPGHEERITGSIATPGYFATMQIPLLAGRVFDATDRATTQPVVVVNETFARRFWSGGPAEALGKRIDAEGPGMATIVGVVGDIKQAEVTDAPEPQVYRPYAQDPVTTMSFVVRATSGDPAALTPAVRHALGQIETQAPMMAVSTMQGVLDHYTEGIRVFATLFAAFALIALLLATAGVYAVMSFFVSQRTKELGLRIALGADPHIVLGAVLRQGLSIAVFGAVLGTLVAFASARLLSSMLYGVSASEPLLYVGSTTMMGIAAVLATYAPARRASSVDPIVALCTE